MLELNLLNIFLSSTAQILKNSMGLDLKKERLFSDNLPHTLHEINVIFGVSGSISTTIVMGMTTITAKKMASLVLSEPVYEESFAGNIVTMVGSDICRTIVENMTQTGFDVYPRYASLVNGKGVGLSTLDDRKLVVGFETKAGPLDLRITI